MTPKNIIKITNQLRAVQKVVNSSPVPLSVVKIQKTANLSVSAFTYLIGTQSKGFGMTKIKNGARYSEIVFSNADFEQAPKVKPEKVKTKVYLTKLGIRKMKKLEKTVNSSSRKFSVESLEKMIGLTKNQVQKIMSEIAKTGGLIHYSHYNKIQKVVINWANIKECPTLEEKAIIRTERQQERDNARTVLSDKALKRRIFDGSADYNDLRNFRDAKNILKKEPK